MKKLTYLALAAIAALSSCQNYDIEQTTSDNNNVKLNAPTLTAGFEEDAATRTTLTDDNRTAWTDGDEVCVAMTTHGSTYGYYLGTYKATPYTSDVTTASLSPSGDAVYDNVTGDAELITAIYPETISVTHITSFMDMLDSYKDSYSANIFASFIQSCAQMVNLQSNLVTTNGETNAPMFGQSTDPDNVTFKNLCGLLAIKIPQTEMSVVKSIELYADTTIAGLGEVTIDGINNPVLKMSPDNVAQSAGVTQSKKITLDCQNATIPADGMTFYIPLPPNTYNSFIIVATDKDDVDHIMATKAGAEIQIERSKLYTLNLNTRGKTAGLARATIDGVETFVNWVQLWEGGPKWATMNVGATTTTGYGGYYCWGSTIDKDSNGAYNAGYSNISGTDFDTARNLWGSKWKMPNKTHFTNLLSTDYTDGGTWVTDYNGEGINGLLVKGKADTDYASNEVFFPAAGIYARGSLGGIGMGCYYWSSTPYIASKACAYQMFFGEIYQEIDYQYKKSGLSVRAILAK